jgi:hypothetical protein
MFYNILLTLLLELWVTIYFYPGVLSLCFKFSILYYIIIMITYSFLRVLLPLTYTHPIDLNSTPPFLNSIPSPYANSTTTVHPLHLLASCVFTEVCFHGLLSTLPLTHIDTSMNRMVSGLKLYNFVTITAILNEVSKNTQRLKI